MPLADWVFCDEHKKRRFRNRKLARTAARLQGKQKRDDGGENHTLHVYECKLDEEVLGYHFGHQPYLVQRGVIGRKQFYASLPGRQMERPWPENKCTVHGKVRCGLLPCRARKDFPSDLYSLRGL